MHDFTDSYVRQYTYEGADLELTEKATPKMLRYVINYNLNTIPIFTIQFTYFDSHPRVNTDLKSILNYIARSGSLLFA